MGVVSLLAFGIVQIENDFIFLLTLPAKHFLLQSCRVFQIAKSRCELAGRVIVLLLKALEFTLKVYNMLRVLIFNDGDFTFVDHLYLFDFIFPSADLLGKLFVRIISHFFDICNQLTLLGFRFTLDVEKLIKQLFVLFLQQVVRSVQ